jgi:triosephosphate isomerase
MRPKIIAGNWKMYKDLRESAELLGGLKAALGSPPPGVQVVVCPPFTSLAMAAEILRGSPISLGAQNMSEFDEGAYTGEISWKMLIGAGCSHVILGHSERRQYSGETDALINRKGKKAIASGLRPIICVGETLTERESGVTTAVIATQIKGVLAGFSQAEMGNVVVAYEPVWAIGTGKVATPAQAQEVHLQIRSLVRDLYGSKVAEEIVLQYGGSVKPDNAAELLSQDDIDGALVGGACLKAESFVAIVNSAE